MHAALIDVEAFLKNFVIVAVFIMLLAVWCVWLAATPSYREFWDTRKAGELSQEPLLIPTVDGKYWTFWQKTGFSVFTKGKEDVFEGIIPQLDCTEPLSEAVFDFLQEEIRAVAKKIRETSLMDDQSWSEEHFFVHDSVYIRTFEKGVCTPEVVSLKEYRYFYPDDASHEGIFIKGRNFVWNGSAMREIALADLFDGSSLRDGFAVLEKEVKKDLIDRDLYDFYIGEFSLEPSRQFLITKEGLKIIFQRYALGGYYSIDSVATVPWNRLSSLLKPGAPVTIWYEKQIQKKSQKR